MNGGLNTLERDDLLRKIAWLNTEVDKIKRMLKGEQVGTARIADAAITNAKIEGLSADKITAGTITVLTQLGETGNAAKIELDGVNTRIVLYEDLVGVSNPQIVLEVS